MSEPASQLTPTRLRALLRAYTSSSDLAAVLSPLVQSATADGDGRPRAFFSFDGDGSGLRLPELSRGPACFGTSALSVWALLRLDHHSTNGSPQLVCALQGGGGERDDAHGAPARDSRADSSTSALSNFPPALLGHARLPRHI